MNSKNPQSKVMELLAPVGSFAAFEAALAEGADAVYLGAPELNARALVRDFTFAEIGAMIQYAHLQGAKVYIAMNSLVKEAELPLALESLAHFDAFKADALIIQDIGLLHLARTGFPDLPLHASTLMSAHNSSAVRMLTDLGCKRVVLPRELTVEEIATIFRKTGAELEVFVHGAMCFSYSGLCLFSSLHGGKSSLRGKCVQPCRRQYSWQKKKSTKGTRQVSGKGGGYLFSMNDLSAIELLPELARAGVKSLKIEGRLKSAEYVRKTIRAYRLLLDNIDKTGSDRQEIQNKARQLLDEAMGRRRSTGFFLSRRPQEVITPHFSGNVGMMVGRVHKLETKFVAHGRQTTSLTVSLRHPLRIGDRLRLHNEKTGERITFTLRSLWVGPRTVQQGNAGQTVRMATQQKFSGKPEKNFKGSLFRVDIGSGRQDEKSARGKILGKAQKNKAPDSKKINNVMRTIAEDSIICGDVSLQNSDTRIFDKGPSRGQAQWWIKVNAFRDMHFRLPMVPGKYIVPVTEENVQQGIKFFKKYYENVIWSFPPVILEDRFDWYFRATAALAQNKYTQFQIGHFSQISLFPPASENQPPLKI
ncbi:MAG: U32 family peptidase, partial [Desulfobulbaceae bacterium]|nr:U32 family peptidase [Desulfobulbaceae bacterium]